MNDAKLGQRYWRWPYWDKESLYFLSSTQIGESNTIKTRVYEDKYKTSTRTVWICIAMVNTRP